MKVLIITYYWPPSGGSGVQRWLKFVKYLQNFGVTPVVYTVDNPQYALSDQTLENDIPKNIEVLKQPIWEPNNILSKLKSKQQQTSSGFLNPNPSFIEKQLQYIRANYFIPDARKFWIKPSIRFLTNYLKENKVDAIITTGPPHSMHLIGLALKQKLRTKWIADFRDPWTDIDYFYQLPLTKKAKQKHIDLEKQVLQNADTVLVVGKTMQENYKKFNKNIHVITNGFDGIIRENDTVLDTKFSITHIGLMNTDRNPVIFWQALAELIKEIPDFRSDIQIKLIGKIADEVRQNIRKKHLQEFVKLIDYLPHNEVMKHQKSTQILLLAVNKVPSAKGIITGKIFEYLQAQRPIIAIAPVDGDLAEIMNHTQSGNLVGFEDKEKLKQLIINNYQQYKKGCLSVASKNIEQYHRKNLAKQLATIIKN